PNRIRAALGCSVQLQQSMVIGVGSLVGVKVSETQIVDQLLRHVAAGAPGVGSKVRNLPNAGRRWRATDPRFEGCKKSPSARFTVLPPTSARLGCSFGYASPDFSSERYDQVAATGDVLICDASGLLASDLSHDNRARPWSATGGTAGPQHECGQSRCSQRAYLQLAPRDHVMVITLRGIPRCCPRSSIKVPFAAMARPGSHVEASSWRDKRSRLVRQHEARSRLTQSGATGNAPKGGVAPVAACGRGALREGATTTRCRPVAGVATEARHGANPRIFQYIPLWRPSTFFSLQSLESWARKGAFILSVGTRVRRSDPLLGR